MLMYMIYLAHNAEIQIPFSKSPHMCVSPNCMAWCIMRLVHFCPYINGLQSALVSMADQAAYAVLACMGVESVRV